VRLRVEVAAFLGLVELGADRDCRPIPPETAEHVGRPGRLLAPAARHEVAEFLGIELFLHLESITAVHGHRAVANDALRSG